jgi:flagellar biosynthesis/type III secretory pathway protein FliH
LAERLIAEAIELDATLVGRLARQSLQQLRERSALVVRAHPEDHEQIQQQLVALKLQSVSLLADTTLKRGELCIDSDLGQLELRIDAGLQRLVDRVRSLLHDDP